MGWTFHDLTSLPKIHDIVWCKWPQREDKGMPGKIVRPVLVRETRIMQTGATKYGAVVISYASGEGINANSNSRRPAFISPLDFLLRRLIESCCLGARNILSRKNT
jgi:hypothetical protein